MEIKEVLDKLYANISIRGEHGKELADKATGDMKILYLLQANVLLDVALAIKEVKSELE